MRQSTIFVKTIEAFERDIGMQFLQKIKAQKPLSSSQQNKTVFCGTGDSFASALLAESFSNFRAKALDPLDVIKNKKLIQGKLVYFVSISGNTISNIKAAKLAKRSVAITRHASSPLAQTCNQVIRLQYQDSNVFTSGSIGFLASMLTCLSLVKNVQIKNTKKLFNAAKAQTAKIMPKNRVYFVGNQHTYPVAMYAAAKMYEVIGADAHYERIEQFSHMGMFSVKKGDTVIIFEEKNKHNTALLKHLKKLGLAVFNPQIKSDNVSQVIFYTFVSQLIALNAAKKKRLLDCYFVTQKKIRKASSAMIY